MSLFIRTYEIFLQKELFGCRRWAKPKAAPSNLWLMTNADSCKFHKRFSDTDLRGFTPGWGCYSIFVEDPLQIGPVFFKTNPICRRDKIQVSSVLTKDYEEKARLASVPKQSQSKPIAGLRPEILSTKY